MNHLKKIYSEFHVFKHIKKVILVTFLTRSLIQVDGSLRFSVYYDQLQSQLVVTVLQVEGLQDHSQKHSLQPFVKLSLMWAGSEVEVEGCTDEEVNYR